MTPNHAETQEATLETSDEANAENMRNLFEAKFDARFHSMFSAVASEFGFSGLKDFLKQMVSNRPPEKVANVTAQNAKSSDAQGAQDEGAGLFVSFVVEASYLPPLEKEKQKTVESESHSKFTDLSKPSWVQKIEMNVSCQTTSR